MTAPTTSSPTTPLPSLRTYLQVLRRQRWLIVAVVALAIVGGVTPSLLAEPTHTATARIQISPLTDVRVFDSGEDQEFATDRTVELYTEIEILLSRRVLEAVLAQFPDGAPQFDDVDATQVGFSEIVSITVTAPEPEDAVAVADTYAEGFVEDRQARSVETLEAQADELRAQGAAAAEELEAIGQQLDDPALSATQTGTLRARQTTRLIQVEEFNRLANQLDVDAALRGRATQVVAPAVASSTSPSDSIVRDGVIGLILGLLLGLALAVVVDTIQDKLSTREELAGLRPDIPVLAAVPHGDVAPSSNGADLAMREAYRYLRTGVRVVDPNSSLRSLLVTSAVAGEGKTTTVANLGRATAEARERVVLVDCDLRQPGLHTAFGLSNEIGVSSLVDGKIGLDRAIHFVSENLAVVTAGPQVANPTELLGSDELASVLRSIVDQADFTIVDTPPALPLADALIAGQLVDGAVVVSRIGGVRRRAVRDLLERLDDAKIPLVGLVANDDPVAATQYGYYGFDGSAQLARARNRAAGTRQ